ncbi:MAG: tetratricopeptide repeat protein [Crocosphaera sp.]|nr:tetratricopeptide repeat protein [Crocosphaera sp.]
MMIDDKVSRSFNIIKPFLILLPIGYGFILLYILAADSIPKAISAFGIMGAVGGASFVLGLLFGFLFGVPKTVKANESSSNSETNKSEIKVQANTNLGEISDWLTKIIVGVGLTQIQPILTFFKTKVVANLAPGFDLFYETTTNYKPSPIAISITIGDITYFFVSGFIIGYVWTVLIFSESLKGTYEQLEEKLDKLNKINNRIQLTRQIIDAIPDTDYLYPDFGYNVPRSEILERLKEIRNSINKILSRLKKEAQTDEIPSDFASFLDDVIKNIDSEDYFFLRSRDYIKLGIVLVLKKDYDNAVRFFEQAIDINKFSYVAHNLKGLISLELKAYDHAIKSFETAIEIDKKDFKGWANKGAALIHYINSSDLDIKEQKKLANEALMVSNRAILLNSGIALTYVNKGIALSLLGADKSEELAAYDKALEIDPKLTLAFYNKACSYALINEPTKAMKNLREAIRINPDIKESVKNDKDFDSLRTNENTKDDFEELINQV